MDAEQDVLWEGRCETWPASLWLFTIVLGLAVVLGSGGVIIQLRSPWYHSALYAGAGLFWFWHIAHWRSQRYRITRTTVERRQGVFRESSESLPRREDDRYVVNGHEVLVWRNEKAGLRELRLIGLAKPELAADALARSGTRRGHFRRVEGIVRFYFTYPVYGPLFGTRDMLATTAGFAALVGLITGLLYLCFPGNLVTRPVLVGAAWAVGLLLFVAFLGIDHLRRSRNRRWREDAHLPAVCLVWPAIRESDGCRGLLGLGQRALVFVPVRRRFLRPATLEVEAREERALTAVDLDREPQAGRLQGFRLARARSADVFFRARLEALATVRAGEHAEDRDDGEPGVATEGRLSA